MLNRHFPSSFLFCRSRKIQRLLWLLCCFISGFLLVAWYKMTHTPDLILPSRWPNFTLILPQFEPAMPSEEDRRFYLVVVVNSGATGAKHRRLRNTIRQTWGNSTSGVDNPAPEHKKWKLFFVLGISENPEDHQLNLEESSLNNDVIMGNFIDRYANLITKTYMSHYWASTSITCQYILKTDDDVFVRVPKLVNWLQEVGSPRPFYGGYISRFHEVPRDPSSKWFITREQYSENDWPPFCHGAYHVLSTDVVPKILNYTTIKRPFHADDAYLAVALNHYGVNAAQIPGFSIEFEYPFRERTDSELACATAIGHKLNTSAMLKYHAFYQRLSKTNLISIYSMFVRYKISQETDMFNFSNSSYDSLYNYHFLSLRLCTSVLSISVNFVPQLTQITCTAMFVMYCHALL